jgi:hypothetical protein
MSGFEIVMVVLLFNDWCEKCVQSEHATREGDCSEHYADDVFHGVSFRRHTFNAAA